MKKLKFRPETPKMSMRKRVMLSLPPVLSIGWIAYIRFGPNSAGKELLAPKDSGTLIMALGMFTIGYLIFLLLMFSEDIGNFFVRRHKANRKI
jgi:hypothetical protein